jgi:ABC-type transport system involved in multi-copper enzyme maturation permease subunit
MAEEPLEVDEVDLLPSTPEATVVDRWSISAAPEQSRSPALSWWPVARVGLGLVIKRRIFKVFVGLGLINFLFFSAMIYFLAGLAAQLKGQRFGEGPLEFARNFIFTGTGESFRDFITSQNTVVMLLLAISGAVLVGNDFRFRSLTFYFSKPLERWQYFLGKLVATSLLVSLLTLLPCLVLFIEYGLFGDTFDYFIESRRILFGILAYGLLVSVGMSILLLGVAALLQKTISIVMVWGLIFIFLPIITEVIHEAARGSDYWKLLDFWSLLQWCSNAFFGIESSLFSAAPWLPVTALVVWLGAALWAFWHKTRAVEVVS